MGIKLAPELKTTYDHYLAKTYLQANQFEKAKALMDRYQMELSTDLYTLQFVVSYHVLLKNWGKAIASAKKVKLISPVMGFTMLGYIHGAMKKQEVAQNYLDSLNWIAANHNIPSLNIAYVHFGMGNDDLGFEALEKAYTNHESSLMNIQVNSPLEIRDDPRYLQLLEKIGFPKAVKN